MNRGHANIQRRMWSKTFRRLEASERSHIDPDISGTVVHNRLGTNGSHISVCGGRASHAQSYINNAVWIQIYSWTEMHFWTKQLWFLRPTSLRRIVWQTREKAWRTPSMQLTEQLLVPRWAPPSRLWSHFPKVDLHGELTFHHSKPSRV